MLLYAPSFVPILRMVSYSSLIGTSSRLAYGGEDFVTALGVLDGLMRLTVNIASSCSSSLAFVLLFMERGKMLLEDRLFV
jgi:hypothetical protein